MLSKEGCPDCGINMERYEKDYNPYLHTKSKHSTSKPIDVGEPGMVSLSSFSV